MDTGGGLDGDVGTVVMEGQVARRRDVMKSLWSRNYFVLDVCTVAVYVEDARHCRTGKHTDTLFSTFYLAQKQRNFSQIFAHAVLQYILYG
jgi:hypothetical protein